MIRWQLKGVGELKCRSRPGLPPVTSRQTTSSHCLLGCCFCFYRRSLPKRSNRLLCRIAQKLQERLVRCLPHVHPGRDRRASESDVVKIGNQMGLHRRTISHRTTNPRQSGELEKLVTVRKPANRSLGMADELRTPRVGKQDATTGPSCLGSRAVGSTVR